MRVDWLRGALPGRGCAGRSRSSLLAVASASAAVILGCQGSVAGPNPSGTAGTAGTPGTGGTSGIEPPPDVTPGAGTGNPPDVPAACDARTLPAQPLRRLSSAQYANTLRALFGEQLAPGVLEGSVFPRTQISAGFAGDAEANIVNTAESNAIEDEAERIAEVVLEAPEPYLRHLLPCELPAELADEHVDACIAPFIDDFGQRAYRRPLTDAEHALAQRVYDELRPAQGAVAAWSALLQFFLQAPALLYRVEHGAAPAAPGLVRLDDFEMATRLSFLLTEGPPDDELLAAAGEGRLSTTAEIVGAAERLLGDPRFAEALEGLHRDWLHHYELAETEKDAALFPAFTAEVRAALGREAGEVARHAFRSAGGTVSALLGSAELPLLADLAPLYGVEPPASEGAVTLLADRRGIFSLVSTMATLSYANRTNPIHRGAFFQREVLCRTLPVLPGDVDTQSALRNTSQLPTARARLAPLLEQPSCAGCHALFNPTGLAFENYDALGQWREQEQGADIDAAGTIEIDGAEATFDDPIELLETVANSAEARDCYALQWYRFALGRREFAEDACSLAELRNEVAATGGDLRSLVLAVVQTDGFLYRREVEP